MCTGTACYRKINSCAAKNQDGDGKKCTYSIDTTPPTMDLTTVSLDAFIADPTSKEGLEEARKAAESLILTGALIVKDSRAPKESNDRFIDLFEDYFAQDREVLQKDERPEWGYQVVCYPFHGFGGSAD
jgi:hypothetical protein